MTPNKAAEFAMPFTCPPTHRRRRLAQTLLGLAAVLPAFGGPALAENDRGAVTRFFDQENARAAPQAASPEVREPAARVHIRPYRADGGRGFERRARPAPAVQTAQKPPAPNPHRINVAVFGDRMGGALAAGLQENDEADVTVLKATSDDAGLTRADFAAWLQSIHDGLPAQHAAAAVMVVGSDDRAPLQDASGPIDPGTPAWQALYGARVDAVAKLFRDAHVPLIWVGLPAVRNPEATADYVRLNGIVRDHATRNGAAFIDSWGGFTDDAGRYSPEGPDVDGQTAKLRRADGFGFTRAGARKLASFVEPDLTRLARHSAATPASALATLTIERARDFDCGPRHRRQRPDQAGGCAGRNGQHRRTTSAGGHARWTCGRPGDALDGASFVAGRSVGHSADRRIGRGASGEPRRCPGRAKARPHRRFLLAEALSFADPLPRNGRALAYVFVAYPEEGRSLGNSFPSRGGWREATGGVFRPRLHPIRLGLRPSHLPRFGEGSTRHI